MDNTDRQLLNLLQDAGAESKSVPELARGKGCNFCFNTGYYGRIGIFEVFRIDEGIRRLILAQASVSEVREAALASGMSDLREMGRKLVLQGISTLDEVQRAVYMEE